MGKQSSLGIIGTNGNALSAGDNSLAGIDLRLASSEVAGNKNITYNIYGLKSFSDSLKGNDVSFGTEINYPNDFLNFRVGYLQIGENYIAGLGICSKKKHPRFLRRNRSWPTAKEFTGNAGKDRFEIHFHQRSS